MQQTFSMQARHRDGAPLELRDYQRDCLEALREYGINGGRRALVAMPTGTGKTVCFAHIAGSASKRVMVIAHREELLEQAQDKIQRSFPELQVEIEQAERRASDGAQIVVASVQTLGISRGRLDRFRPDEFSAIIVDEAHHTMAPTYLRVLQHFGLVPYIDDMEGEKSKKVTREEMKRRYEAFTPESTVPYLVGFTATPSRSDRIGLEYVYDEIAFQRSMLDMMEAGWLSRIRGLRVNTGVDISKIRTRAGDFSEKELSAAVNVNDRNALAINAYREHAEGRQALVFAVDVAHTIELTELFRAAGYAAAYVVGSASQMELPRADIIDAYQRGDIRVLINCMVLTEGFDAPETSCIIMARPTKSQLLYTQMLGRGTRIAPGKEDCLVIDLADTAGLGVADMNTLFGFPPKLEMPSDADVLSLRGALEEIGDGIPLELFETATTVQELRTLGEQYDPLAQVQVDPNLNTNLRWVKTAYGYAISIPVEGGAPVQIGVVEDMLGNVEVRKRERGRRVQALAKEGSVQQAIDVAEAWVTEHHPSGAGLLDKSARWQRNAPSLKQKNFAKRLKIAMPPGITSGDLSALIDAKLNRKF